MKHEPLPNRLRVLRAERRMTQWDTSDAAVIAINRYVRIEHGRATPRQAEVKRLARVFGVPADALGFGAVA